MKVRYISKGHLDAIREVDVHLMDAFKKIEQVQVEERVMPYRFHDSSVVRLLDTLVLFLASLPRIMKAYIGTEIVHFSSITNYYWFLHIVLRHIFPKVGSIITVHHITVPSNNIRRRIWGCLFNSFDGIATVSEASKRSIVECLGIDQKKIYVVRNGIDQEYFNTDVSARSASSTRRSFLCVGEEYPRKNLSVIFQAIKLLKEEGMDCELVKVGRVKSINDAMRTDRSIQELGIADRVYVDRRPLTISEINALYKNTVAVLSPSTLEGYGLPVAEAAAAGSVLLISKILPYLEFKLPPSCYVEEYLSPQAWAKAMEQVFTQSEETRREVIQAQSSAVCSLTWERSAQTLIECYHSVCSKAK